MSPWAIQLIIAIASMFASYVMTSNMLRKGKSGGEASEFEKPTASSGKVSYVVFGTRLIKDPNVIWFGSTGAVRAYEDNVPCWMYYSSIQFAVCQGPVDRVNSIYVGERKLTLPTPTLPETDVRDVAVLNKPGVRIFPIYGDENFYMFGGLRKEGGCSGTIDVCLGAHNQEPNAYVESVVGIGKQSAYRDMLTLTFRGSSPTNNGYMDDNDLGLDWTPAFVDIDPLDPVVGWITDGGGVYNEIIITRKENTMKVYPGDDLILSHPYNTLLYNRTLDTNSEYVYTPMMTSDGYQIAYIDADYYYHLLSENSDGFWESLENAVNEEAAAVNNIRRNGFFWASNNAYFKSVWVSVQRITKGWDDVDGPKQPWYPQKLTIIQNDVDEDFKKTINPIHILYQLITSVNFGMGYPISEIDNDNFVSAADTLYNENFGISIVWSTDGDIESFIKGILEHISAVLYIDNKSGKYCIKLLRADYNINTLSVYNEDNILKINSFQRNSLGETPNELTLTYYDHLNKPQSVTVQDLAGIHSQGRVIGTTKDYPGIISPFLAKRVASRDLDLLCTPLIKVSFTCDRKNSKNQVGELIRLSWQDLGFEDMIFRIIEIKSGTFESSQITITAVEDIFSIGEASYLGINEESGSGYIDNRPLKLLDVFIEEMGYWDYMRRFPSNIRSTHPVQACFPKVFGIKPRPFSEAMRLYRRDGDNVYIEASHRVAHCSHGTLKFALLRSEQDQLILNPGFLDAYNLRNVPKSDIYAHVGDELIGFSSLEYLPDGSALANIKRGVLDTIPANHVEGTDVYLAMITGTAGYDPNPSEYAQEKVYRMMDVTGYEFYSQIFTHAKDLPIQFKNRIDRPYNVACIKINGEINPDSVPQGDIELSYRNRGKAALLGDLVSYYEDVDYPTTVLVDNYVVKFSIYEGTSTDSGYKRTYEQGSADYPSSFTYSEADQLEDGNPTVITIEVKTNTFTNGDPQLGDDNCWQSYVHTFTIV